jgi:hypothetical protein
MRRYPSSLLFAALTAVSLLNFCGTEAKAGYNITGPTITPAGSGQYLYTYSVSITANSESVASSNFFRIYDFGGYVVGSGAVPAYASSFTITNAATNPVPPPNVILLHGDDPAIQNVTFAYIGSTPISGPLSFNITLLSTNPGTGTGALVTKDFAGQSTNTSNSSLIDTRTDVVVPSAVPEPASIISVAFGVMLLGAGYVARSRAKTTV